MSTLETAIADKREHPGHGWKDSHGNILSLDGGWAQAVWPQDTMVREHPPLDGWTLVEEHKPCAHCGNNGTLISDIGGSMRICCRGCCSYSTGHDAQAAWAAWDRRVTR